MGVRGRRAAFMPGRRVFPGGSVDPVDCSLSTHRELAWKCLERLRKEIKDPALPVPLALAGIRELYEESGLAVGVPSARPVGGPGVQGTWKSFYAAGLEPALDQLQFFFRAITPPDYPMRFDARFFLVSATAVYGSIDDLSKGSGELQDLKWLPVAEAIDLGDLPCITQVVLREVREVITSGNSNRPVPFYGGGRFTGKVEYL